MSFADEIRNQAKTKEQVVREAAEEAAKRESQEREGYRIYLGHEFKKIKETIKSRIAEAAQSGNYRTEGSAKLIQDAFEIGLAWGWNVPGSIGWDNYGIEATRQVLKEKRSLLDIYMPKSLDRILLKTIYSDVFQSAFREMIDGLRRDGIEAAFVVEWSIPYKYKYHSYGREVLRRTYQIPFERLSEGYTIQDWFIPASSTINRLEYEDGPEYDDGHRRYPSKKLRCTYQFRF